MCFCNSVLGGTSYAIAYWRMECTKAKHSLWLQDIIWSEVVYYLVLSLALICTLMKGSECRCCGTTQYIFTVHLQGTFFHCNFMELDWYTHGICSVSVLYMCK